MGHGGGGPCEMLRIFFSHSLSPFLLFFLLQLFHLVLGKLEQCLSGAIQSVWFFLTKCFVCMWVDPMLLLINNAACPMGWLLPYFFMLDIKNNTSIVLGNKRNTASLTDSESQCGYPTVYLSNRLIILNKK